ncbi:MAG: hypothetical protein M1546_02030 [Chloroflexi bacterium]|nr:hypothetical protein [Chloroflexota bacterium]
MTAIVIAHMLALGAMALVVYAALVWLAGEYSRRTGWQPPDGCQDSDWVLRRNLGVVCGALALAVCAVCSVLFLAGWPARIFVMAQAALMAAMGASDLRRFHLPLPFTLAGIALAVAAALVTRIPTLLVLFGLIWALVVVLLHALLSKGSMQLGDHIATVWIALASPFNGLLAVAAGDFANVILVRIKGLRGKKVAAAGAWLVFAAGLSGLPPYFAWFAGPQTQTLAKVSEPSQGFIAVTWMPPSVAGPEATRQPSLVAQTSITQTARTQAMTAAALVRLSEWAADDTARVALAEQRADRITAAKSAAVEVAGFAALARRIAPGSNVAVTLNDLAGALAAYDVDGVRNASERLAGERLQLAQSLIILTEVVTPTLPSIMTPPTVAPVLVTTQAPSAD